MLFWIPLMAGADDPAVIDWWKEVVLARVDNRSRRDDLVTIATIFAELIGTAPAWRKAMHNFGNTESPLVNEWINQGALEGMTRSKRQYLLELLKEKFPGQMPTEIERLIQEQDSLDVLDHWFKQAIHATTFEEFLTVVKA
jgi:hypothetical protein